MSALCFTGDSGAHIDAYMEYLHITGEDSGAPLLSEAEYARRRQQALDNAANRIYCFWTNSSGLECRTVGPQTRCICRCPYKKHVHAVDRPTRCKTPGCGCECFSVLPGHGSSYSRCSCKHTADEHDQKGSRRCARPTCSCRGFICTGSCTCGEKYNQHKTMFYTVEQRKAMGKYVEEMLPPVPSMGGLTNFSSILGEAPLSNSEQLLKAPEIGSQSELDMLYEIRKKQELEARRSRYKRI
ncbi:hypothetical protein RCL1_008177 [Eukaryota sp. TZLM3-RCL]